MYVLPLFGAAAALVLLACLVPNRWLPPQLPNDKLLHGLAFGGLSVLALPLARSWTEGGALLLALFAGGVAVECLQQLLTERRFCWYDIRANGIGIAAVGGAALLYSVL